VFIRPSCTRLPEKELYDFDGKGGGPSYYKYDKFKRLLKKTFVRSDGLKTTTEYSYLGNGLLMESIRLYNDGTRGTFTYGYNEWDQLVQRDFQCTDGSTAQEQYTYDQFGRLTSGSYRNYDGWLNGDLSFRHDRYDRIISATFNGKNCWDAELSFEYNIEGNLAKIHWVFSSGTTQTYTYFY